MLYSLDKGSQTEVSLDGKVYDIVDASGGIIEIQTGSVSSLRGKIKNALLHSRTIKVVHPIAVVKTIESRDKNGTLIRRRASPVHLSIYNIWKEITGITEFLLHPCFTLEVLEIEMTQVRVLLSSPSQSANNRRRHYKAWNNVDKRLDKILAARTFSTASDYTALIPSPCPKVFCARDVADALLMDKALPSSAAKQSGYMLWVLFRMGLLQTVTNIDEHKHINGSTTGGRKRGGKTKYYRQVTP